MMNFQKLKKIVGRTLGVSALTALTDEQKAMIEGKFGKTFADSFLSELDKENASAQNVIDAVAKETDLSAEITSSAEFQALNDKFNSAVAEMEQTKKELADARQLIDALSAEPEPDTARRIDPGKATLPAVRVDMTFRHNKAAADMIRTGIMAADTPTLDVSELTTEFGKVIRSDEKKEILHSIYNDFTSRKYFKQYNATLEWQAIQAVKQSVVQQFTPKWTPSNGYTFKPLTIRNFHHKINVALKPTDVLESWLMWLYDERKSPDQMPLIKYIIDYMILPQILEDLELKMVWKGKYKEASGVTDGSAATPPQDSMNGIETILVEALKNKGTDNDTGINFIDSTLDLDTATPDQILAHAENFRKQISPLFKTKNMPLFCSLEYYEAYKIAFKEKWGQYSGTENPFFGGDRLDYSRLWLVPIDGMYGSPIIFATPVENMIMLRNINVAPNVINDIQRENYDVKIFGEFWLGVGFALGEAVFASVPADYDPQAVFAPAEPDPGTGDDTDGEETQTEGL